MFTLPSSLSAKNSFITLEYEAETGIVKATLSLEEISALYRRCPLHMHWHHYELSASAHLLNVLAECMKYARTEKLKMSVTAVMTNPIASASHDTEETSNVWDLHFDFYNTLLQILDPFADLEEMLNCFEDKTINNLKAIIDRYEEKINTIFGNAEGFKELKALILADIARFKKNIAIHDKLENTKALLSNSLVTNGIFPLGHFVIEQVERVAVALAQFRRNYEDYAGKEDYLDKSEDCQKIDVLIDNTLAFLKSFAGTRFSTAKPIPKETIAVLRTAAGRYEKNDTQRYYVILNDFIKSSEQADPRVWVKLFCEISGGKPPSVDSKSVCLATFINCGLILATPIEVGIFFPVRIVLVLVAGIVASIIQLCLNVLHKIKVLNDHIFTAYTSKIQEFLDNADVLFDVLYHTCSMVGYLRAQREANQTLKYAEAIENKEDENHVEFLKQIALNRKNSIAYFAKENFKASYVEQGIEQGVQGVGNFIYE
ncbi:MAG: hypothetical protein V4496_06680, partial [Pseudomonadota bacterium]